MDKQDLKRKSKLLSLILRHQPEVFGLELDEAGWVDVEVLLSALAKQGKGMARDTLETVVQSNDKQRFSFSEDGTRIRANQGHSINIDLGYQVAVPPAILIHGTPQQFVVAISQEGLRKMKRHHVHLHADENTARAVGQRRGKPVLLRVRAGEMHEAGFEFFLTPNQVWLTEQVPVEYIDFP